MLRRRWAAIVCAAASVGVLPSGAPPARAALTATDWPTYGASAHHTFSVASDLDAVTVQTLTPKWFFATGDSVTANPIKVGSRVYVGSWDGNFYALDAETGEEVWRFQTAPQPAVHPIAGESVIERLGDVESDGGIITSSAWYEPAHGDLPNLVIFAGGFTLYALDVDTTDPDQRLLWSHVYPGTGVNGTANPNLDGTRIFTSPVVVNDQVVFGTTADGHNGYRGYVAAADLATGNPKWSFETDVQTVGGPPLNDGCGGVWSSPTVDEVNHLVITAVSDCDFLGRGPYGERVIALHLGGTQPDGELAWVYTPPRLAGDEDPPCDFDFGATANLGTVAATGQRFLGIGGKDGNYYALDPATGAQLHEPTNVVFGGEAGGFIGTTAFDGTRAYGATALGDFPNNIAAGIGPGFVTRTFGGGGEDCALLNPRDNGFQEPSVHAINADGTVAWEDVLGSSFGPTTVSNGLVYSAATFLDQIQIREAATGALVKVLPAPSGSASGVVISGKWLYFGTGVFLPGPAVDGVYAWAAA